MPKPTIQQLFGAGATVANNKLTIDFADFTAEGWNTAAGTVDAEKWFTAIILKAHAFTSANTDQVPNIDIQEPYPGLTTRNAQLKREYAYTVQVYVPDTGNAAPDPDLM
jgi:hypothetical protein